MCGQWGDTGIYREKETPLASDGQAEQERIRELIGLKRQLGLADYVRLLDEVAPHRPVISLFGGEPFLFPDIIPLIRDIKRRGLTVTIITNGWFLERNARELVELGVDTIAVSIDGPPDLHDRIRGRESSFDRAAAGVRAVARFRKEMGRGLPVQMAILPITELNVTAVDAAIAALQELPLDLVNVGLRWFIPKEVGAEYEHVMQRDLGVSGESWKGFDFKWPGGDDAGGSKVMQALVGSLKTLRRSRIPDWLSGKPWTSFVPAVAPEDVPAYFTDFNQTFGHDLCPVAWYFAQVEADGEVCFCGDFPDYFIGNVRDQPFTEIWHGERAGAFRAKLAREPLPICARCCGSFVYGKWQRPVRAADLALRPAVPPQALRPAGS